LAFLIIFTIELGMQFAFYGWRIILDGWLVFDLIIITLSWTFSSVQIIRAFRIFRAFRLITRIKVLKNLVTGVSLFLLLNLSICCALQIPFFSRICFRISFLRTALFSVVPRMFAIFFLLFLVSYIFAVMFTQLFKDLYEDGYTDTDYFGRMDTTFFTLFQIMTLDNWAAIARQVMEAPNLGWTWLPFIIFVIITGFVVVNLIIAVICDAISALQDDEKAKLLGTFEEDSEDSEDGDDSDIISGNEGTESEHPAFQQDVQAQLNTLEEHVKELASMQEDSLMTLKRLTRLLRAQRNRDESSTKHDG
jgi:hypothetical protein